MRKFTLIELLVVIAIIGILASILLPSLSKARLKSERVVDLSNARQFTTVCIIFADDNDGKLPTGYRGWGNDDYVWFNNDTKDTMLDDYDMPDTAMGCSSYPKDTSGAANNSVKWIYWGGRRNEFTDGSEYITPVNLNDEPTSKTLVTCWNYISYSGWDSMLGHAPRKSIQTGGTTPESIPVKPDGLNVIRMDASGKWSNRNSLSVIRNYNYLYYLKD